MRIDESVSFGNWLRRRRKALDLTQAQLAQRAGCATATIRKIEADERKPSWQLAEMLATVLAVPEDARATYFQAARRVQALQPTIVKAPSSAVPATASIFSVDSHRLAHNLPAQVTTLVDRAHDAANVIRLLTRSDTRLVTLLGPPGIGKTRLCIHTAQQVAEQFRDGVWFVDLAPITDATLVLAEIAHILSISEVGASSLLDRLRATLAEKEILLVLDNCEQVSAAAVEVAKLLRGCSRLKILATSQTPLLLAGEHEYALPPLSLPPPDIFLDGLTVDQLMAYEAVQLFVTRVRQFRHDFSTTHADARQICDICLRLDGIPLAIELAAAALRRMTLAQLAALLHKEENWLHELHSPARDLPPRQRTLYHAIAWSYSLLDASAQDVFRQLGVFVDGFETDAAQAVCGADQAMLARLTEHNLLMRAPDRWRMLEMIRAFALAQMTNEELKAAQQRHITYFATQATVNIQVSVCDHANMRAALEFAIAAQKTEAAFTLCIGLCWFWEGHGYLREGMTLARAVLAVPDEFPVNMRIDVLERVATFAWQAHQLDTALQYAEEAVFLARSYHQPGKVALALNLLGRILIEQSEYENAEAALEENTQIALQASHLFNPGCPLTLLGEVALSRGGWEAARTRMAQALPFLMGEHESPYDRVFFAMAHTNSAEIALAYGNPKQARDELLQALPQARLYIRRFRCLLVTLAGLLLHTRSTAEAKDLAAATELLGAVSRLGEHSGDVLSPFYEALIARRSEHTRQNLTQPIWEAAWQVGCTWTRAQAVAEAESQLGSILRNRRGVLMKFLSWMRFRCGPMRHRRIRPAKAGVKPQLR